MSRARDFMKEKALSVSLLILFVVCFDGSACCGFYSYNDTLAARKVQPVFGLGYLRNGAF